MDKSDKRTFAWAQQKCPELRDLPDGWYFNFDTAHDHRVYFLKDGANANTYDHPTLGPLPKPWILKKITNYRSGIKDWTVVYYNRDTKAFAKTDPRLAHDNLVAEATSAAPILKTHHLMSQSHKQMGVIDWDLLERGEIFARNIEHHFERIHAIDEGDGSLGAMNGGVFVVRARGMPSRLLIQKQFKVDKDFLELAKSEIELLHRVKHPALTQFVAAFFVDKGPNPAASLYIEFCDRGSLKDLISRYRDRSEIPEIHTPHVPEQFCWHLLGGLADALAYLQTGSSQINTKNPRVVPGWVPILHRDIKPDNILLRSRSSAGSKNYFYCVLSDFGLACENPFVDNLNEHPDIIQRSGGMCGTSAFLAPELCHDPYPLTVLQDRCFPENQRHSKRSDLWAVGVCVYNLCEQPHRNGDLCHINWGAPERFSHKDMNDGRWSAGRMGKVMSTGGKYRIPKHYTTELYNAVIIATVPEVTMREDPLTYAKSFEKLFMEASKKIKMEYVPLEEWTTRKHEYFSKANQLSKR